MKKSYLDFLVDSKLSGDKSRAAELFYDDSVLDLLKANSTIDDWYFFEVGTYDGDYLIKSNDSYICFYQERGRRTELKEFSFLKDAAEFLFRSTGYFK